MHKLVQESADSRTNPSANPAKSYVRIGFEELKAQMYDEKCFGKEKFPLSMGNLFLSPGQQDN